MKNLYIEIKEGIKNFIYFGKAIWKFRGWDHGYTEAILLLCLEKTYNEILTFKYGWKEKSRELKQLRIAINCLKRIKERNNGNSLIDQYRKRTLGELELKLSKEHRLVTLLNGEIMSEKDKDAWIKLSAEDSRQEKQDYEMLGNMLKHLRLWWT